MYQSIWSIKNKKTNISRVWVWDDKHGLIEDYKWENKAYVEDPNGTYVGLNGKKLNSEKLQEYKLSCIQAQNIINKYSS